MMRAEAADGCQRVGGWSAATAPTGRWLQRKRQGKGVMQRKLGATKTTYKPSSTSLSAMSAAVIEDKAVQQATSDATRTARALPVVLTEAALREQHNTVTQHPLMEDPLELRPLVAGEGSSTSGRSTTGARTAEFFFAEGFRARARGDFEQAVHMYDKALGIGPDFKAAFNRGYTLQLLGRLEEALAAYEEAKAICPGNIHAAFNAAGCLLNLDRAKESAEMLDAGVSQLQEHVKRIRGEAEGRALSVSQGNYVALLVKLLRARGYAQRIAGAYTGASSDYEQASRLQGLLQGGGQHESAEEGELPDISHASQAKAGVARAAARWGSSGIMKGGESAKERILAAQLHRKSPGAASAVDVAATPEARAAQRRAALEAEVEARMHGGSTGVGEEVFLPGHAQVAAVLPVWEAEHQLQTEQAEFSRALGVRRSAVLGHDSRSRGELSSKAVQKLSKLNHAAAVAGAQLRQRGKHLPSTSSVLAGVQVRRKGGVAITPRRTTPGAMLDAPEGGSEGAMPSGSHALESLRTVVSRAALRRRRSDLDILLQPVQDGEGLVDKVKHAMWEEQLLQSGRWGAGTAEGDVVQEASMAAAGTNRSACNRARVHLSSTGGASTAALPLLRRDGSQLPTHGTATAELLGEGEWSSTSTLAAAKAGVERKLPFFINSSIPLLALPMAFSDGPLFTPTEIRPSGSTLASADLVSRCSRLLPSLPAQEAAEQAYAFAMQQFKAAKQSAAAEQRGLGHGSSGSLLDLREPRATAVVEPSQPPDPHKRLNTEEIDFLCRITDRFGIFTGVAAAVHRALVQRMYVQQCRQGQVVSRQGEVGSCMYFIVDGSVDVYLRKGATMHRRIKQAKAALRLGRRWADKARVGMQVPGDGAVAGGGKAKPPLRPAAPPQPRPTRGAESGFQRPSQSHHGAGPAQKVGPEPTQIAAEAQEGGDAEEEEEGMIIVPEYTAGVGGELSRGVGVPGYEHARLGSMLGSLMAGEGWGQSCVAVDTSVQQVLQAAQTAPSGPTFREASVVAREPTLLLALRREDYERVVRGTAAAVVQGIAEFLGRVRLMEPATAREVQALARRVHFKRFACGECVVRQGETLEGLYIIVRGKCSVHQVQGGGAGVPRPSTPPDAWAEVQQSTPRGSPARDVVGDADADLQSATNPGEVRRIIHADMQARIQRLHRRTEQNVEVLAGMSGRLAVATRAQSRQGARSGVEQAAVLELGALLPGDWIGEDVVMSASLHRPGGRGIHSLPEQERLQAYASAKAAPATVVCETAAEVMVLSRGDMFQVLSFASRQRMRELLRRLPSARRVVTPAQKVAWGKYAKDLVSREMAHKQAERGRRGVWDGFGLSLQEALQAAKRRRETPGGDASGGKGARSRGLYRRKGGVLHKGPTRPSTAGPARRGGSGGGRRYTRPASAR